MITVLKSNLDKLGKFKTYADLTPFLMHLESKKLSKDHPQFGRADWSFMVYSHKRILLLLDKMKDSFCIEIFKEAYQKELEILEICTGDFYNPTYIKITPDLDLEAARKNWCEKYCQAHGYTLIDHPAVPPVPKKIGDEDDLEKPDKPKEGYSREDWNRFYPYIIYIRLPFPFAKGKLIIGRLTPNKFRGLLESLTLFALPWPFGKKPLPPEKGGKE